MRQNSQQKDLKTPITSKAMVHKRQYLNNSKNINIDQLSQRVQMKKLKPSENPSFAASEQYNKVAMAQQNMNMNEQLGQNSFNERQFNNQNFSQNTMQNTHQVNVHQNLGALPQNKPMQTLQQQPMFNQMKPLFQDKVSKVRLSQQIQNNSQYFSSTGNFAPQFNQMDQREYKSGQLTLASNTNQNSGVKLQDVQTYSTPQSANMPNQMNPNNSMNSLVFKTENSMVRNEPIPASFSISQTHKLGQSQTVKNISQQQQPQQKYNSKNMGKPLKKNKYSKYIVSSRDASQNQKTMSQLQSQKHLIPSFKNIPSNQKSSFSTINQKEGLQPKISARRKTEFLQISKKASQNQLIGPKKNLSQARELSATFTQTFDKTLRDPRQKKIDNADVKRQKLPNLMHNKIMGAQFGNEGSDRKNQSQYQVQMIRRRSSSKQSKQKGLSASTAGAAFPKGGKQSPAEICDEFTDSEKNGMMAEVKTNNNTQEEIFIINQQKVMKAIDATSSPAWALKHANKGKEENSMQNMKTHRIQNITDVNIDSVPKTAQNGQNKMFTAFPMNLLNSSRTEESDKILLRKMDETHKKRISANISQLKDQAGFDLRGESQLLKRNIEIQETLQKYKLNLNESNQTNVLTNSIMKTSVKKELKNLKTLRENPDDSYLKHLNTQQIKDQRALFETAKMELEKAEQSKVKSQSNQSTAARKKRIAKKESVKKMKDNQYLNIENFELENDEEHSFGISQEPNSIFKGTFDIPRSRNSSDGEPISSEQPMSQQLSLQSQSIPAIQKSFKKHSLMHTAELSSGGNMSNCNETSRVLSEEVLSNGGVSRKSQRSNQSISITRTNLSKKMPKLQNFNNDDLSFNSINNSSSYAQSNQRAFSRRQEIRDMEIQAPAQHHNFEYVSRQEKVNVHMSQSMQIQREIDKEHKMIVMENQETKIIDHSEILNLRLANIKQLSIKQLAKYDNLTQIDIRNNRLTQLPDQICEFMNLKEFKVDYNFLTTLPNGINKLQKLEVLSASQNVLKTIPFNVLVLRQNLKSLILNDNKIMQIQSKIGNLVNLEILLLHNNMITEVPSSMYRLQNLEQLSLDWFAYINNDLIQFQTKHLKGMSRHESILADLIHEEQEEARKHQQVINQFLDYCKLTQVLQLKQYLENRQKEFHRNPQQDDSEPRGTQMPFMIGSPTFSNKEIPPAILSKGVSSKRRRNNAMVKEYAEADFDPMSNQKPVKITFLKFLMYFYKIVHLDQLILKTVFPSKQRKLSHLIALLGHSYLFKDMLKQIDLYHHNCLSQATIESNYLGQGQSKNQNQNVILSQKALNILQMQYQFLNSIDRDFSTPLILAIHHKKYALVKILLDHPKTCLRQSSMKYGTSLHVALSNHEFKTSYKLLKMLKDVRDFNPIQDLNKIDDEGNNPLHITMRIFNKEQVLCSKIALFLIKRGVNLQFKNKKKLTPLLFALYYAQNEAIKFALNHNKMIRQRRAVEESDDKYAMFDFNEQGGRLNFTPLHFTVYQNNFQVLFMLLRSCEKINHELEDTEGRRAIDLCSSISAIFKSLKRALKNQRDKFAAENLIKWKKSEPTSQTGQQKIIGSMSISHLQITRRTISLQNLKALEQSAQVEFKRQTSTLGQRNISISKAILRKDIDKIDVAETPNDTQRRLKHIYGAMNTSIEHKSRDMNYSMPTAFGRKITIQQNQTQKIQGFAFNQGRFANMNERNNSTIKSLKIDLQQLHNNQTTGSSDQYGFSTQRAFKFSDTIEQNAMAQKKKSAMVIGGQVLGLNMQNADYFEQTQNNTARYLSRKRSMDDFTKLNFVTDTDQGPIDSKFKSVNQIIQEIESDNQIMRHNRLLSKWSQPEKKDQLEDESVSVFDTQNIYNKMPQKNQFETQESALTQFFTDSSSMSKSSQKDENDESEIEDANVSEEDENFEDNLNTYSQRFENSRAFRNSFMEKQLKSVLQNSAKSEGHPRMMHQVNNGNQVEESKIGTIDFNADADNIVRDIMKHHKIEEQYDKLHIIETVNQSLEGNQVPQLSQPQKNPSVILNTQSEKHYNPSVEHSQKLLSADFDNDELQLSDNEDAVAVPRLNISQNRFTAVNEAFRAQSQLSQEQEQRIEPVQNSKSQMMIHKDQKSSQILDEVGNNESERRNHNHMLISYQIARKSNKKDSMPCLDRKLLEDIQGPAIKVPDFNSKMSDQASTFRKKRQSYLAHEVNALGILGVDHGQHDPSFSEGSLIVSESKPPKMASCNDSDNLYFSDLPVSEQIESGKQIQATQKPQISNNQQLNLLSSRERDLTSGPDQQDFPSKLVIHHFLKSKGYDEEEQKSHTIERLNEIVIQLKNEEKVELPNNYRIELLSLMDKLHSEKFEILKQSDWKRLNSQFINDLGCVFSKMKQLSNRFIKNQIIYDVENMLNELKRHAQNRKALAQQKEQKSAKAPFQIKRLDLSKLSEVAQTLKKNQQQNIYNTQRQTMKNRPLLQQTNQPRQLESTAKKQLNDDNPVRPDQEQKQINEVVSDYYQTTEFNPYSYASQKSNTLMKAQANIAQVHDTKEDVSPSPQAFPQRRDLRERRMRSYKIARSSLLNDEYKYNQ